MRIEEVLYKKQRKAFNELKGLRKPEVDDIFRRVIYLGPEDFKMVDYKKPKPVAVFNPGALLKNRKLIVLPRFIFDYYKYVSSIGLIELDIENVISGNVETPIKSRIIIWPQQIWEFLGCEDPRAFRDENLYYILYTGKGYLIKNGGHVRTDVLALAQLDDSWRLVNKGFFSITDGNESFIPKSNKDSAFIEGENGEYTLLTRPEIGEKRICWRGRANVDELKIYEDSLEPVLIYESWELKVGWSTNVVKLSSNEYLVGWHGVLIEDYSYKNGLALVDKEGNLLAVSNYLLSPKGLIEEYGDRPLVIFGDGLVKYKEYILWIGGISDYAIAIFAAEIDDIMEKLNWI